MAFRDEAQQLIQQKKFDDLESVWMNQIDSDPSDVDSFLHVAKVLRKADQRIQADTLLGLLADSLKERKLWAQRLAALKEIGRLSKHPAHLRAPIEEALRKSVGDRKAFNRAFEFSKFSDPASNPIEKADKIGQWLTYDEGECFFMPGRGAGVIIELNPELGICRIDFEKEKRVAVPMGAAGKFLTSIPKGHVLREKFSSPDKLRAEAAKSPADMFARILQSFGRAMAMSEVRDSLIGVVPEEKWASWWTAARKNPQIVVSGSGAKATYSWSASAGDASNAIRRDFDRADAKTRLDLARKHAGRSKDLAEHFYAALSADATKLARTDPPTAWQILALLDDRKQPLPIELPALLSGPAAARVINGIADKPLRERGLAVIRENHADWPKIFSEAFFLDQEPRILSVIHDELDKAGQTAIRDRVVDETLRYPRRHPHAFYWFVKKLNEDDTNSPRANYALLFQILDAISSDEFATVRPRLREMFEKGGLGIRIVLSNDNEEQARKLAENLERYGGLEEYRREILKNALVMKYPALREPQAEPVYATAEMLTKKRGEIEHLTRVEIPANSKAIQVAREMGDLRENFEYKAARQRAEYLAARVRELDGEIGRVRVIDPAQVDTSAVRVGAKVRLSNGDIHRDVTILGPWESSPEHGVYSNQSDVAKKLIGHASGDIVSFMGNDYQIESIVRWNE